MKTSFKSAFTLVELLIAMAIIAVLIAIAAYGIAIVQRNSRNSQRAGVANELKVAIEKFYTNFGTYPLMTDMCINATERSIEVNRGTFEEPVVYRSANLIPAASTTPNTSAYCYSRSANGLYSIQYQVEILNSGTNWSQNLGTWQDPCEDDGPASIINIGNC